MEILLLLNIFRQHPTTEYSARMLKEYLFELTPRIQVSYQTISRYLRALRTNNFVDSRQPGRIIYYKLKNKDTNGNDQ